MKNFFLVTLALVALAFFSLPLGALAGVGALAILSPMSVVGGKRGRPKGSTGNRRSAMERAMDTIARAKSQAWSLLRDAITPTNSDGSPREGYIPRLGKISEGLVRAKRDVKRFSFYADSKAVDERIAALQDRIDRTRKYAQQVQSGEKVRSDAVLAADDSFKRFSDTVFSGLVSGKEPNIAEAFDAAFPKDLQDVLVNYSDVEDPFPGTEDESEDSEESETEPEGN